MELINLLKEMTLDEKIGQLFQSCISDETIDDVCAMIEKGEIGSCILTDTDIAGTSDDSVKEGIVQKIRKAGQKSRLKIPVILGRDIIHGSRTTFPIPLAQAASFDTELANEGAYRMASEASKEGVEWTFAPMLDIAHDPRWGRVIEGFGEDPYLASRMSSAYVKGIQKSGMAACAKHYIGYGACEGGVDYAKSEITDYTLRNIYLPPFRAAVEAGVATVMNSFGNIGGTPSVANSYIFRDILKGELNFGGFVISDWGSIKWQIDAGTALNEAECAEKSLKAGIDMEMATTCYKDNLKQLVSEGKIDISLIDEAVLRILKIKEKFCGNAVMDYSGVCSKDDRDFAEKAALNSSILLKNDNNVLPLKDEVFVLSGPFAKEKRGLLGSWCAGPNTDNIPTLFDELNVIYGKNMIFDNNIYHTKNRFYDAETVVLALGDDYSDTGERSSMADPQLDSAQLELAKRAKKLGKKVVAVVFGGRPLILSELEMYADAILYCWHSGIMAARAAAKIISGAFNPCAKTPITFLRSIGQVPMYYNCMPIPIRRKPDEFAYYTEPEFSAYNDELSTPLYPFGYGLSYTKFCISDIYCEQTKISQDKLNGGAHFTVSVELSNVGDANGAEICQMYVCDCVSEKVRPIKELRGFEKIFLKSGEKGVVTFNIGKNELGYYPDKELVAESGEYVIFIGNSCMTENKITIEVI